MTLRQKLDRLAVIARASDAAVREQIITIAMDMSLPLNQIERSVGALARRGLLTVGTLPPPKGKADDDFSPRRQIIFKSTAFGDDADRSLTKYPVELPAEVLEIYLAHLAERADVGDDNPREIGFTNGGAR